jgi:hypothetical protein
MTLPKKQGYLPTASHLISSVKPTFIPSQKYCKEDILLHPLCITLLCEKYKLKTLLNDIIENKKGSKQLNVVSMKQIESNIELQRSRTGKKCLKWNDKKSLDLLMLNLVNEAVLNQKLLEETLKKDSVLKSDKLIDILKDSFRKLNRSVYSHKRANDNANYDSSSNYTRNLKRSRLSPDATTYLLKWFELVSNSAVFTQINLCCTTIIY